MIEVNQKDIDFSSVFSVLSVWGLSQWRRVPESNRATWICNPVHNRFANTPRIGAGNEARTRDPDLGKVVLYQLSYSRVWRFSRRDAAYFTDFKIAVKQKF